MTRFTKAEMMEEFREVIYQFARSASFCLDPEAGYRLLFNRKPNSDADVCHFMNPEVDSTTYDEPFSIDRFQATKTVGEFYDYGLLGIRNMSPVDSGGANEWTFTYGLIHDVSRSSLIYESKNGDFVDASKCLHAAKAFFARLILDGLDRTGLSFEENLPSDMLTLAEVAILAGLDERTVRNATVKTATNRLDTAVIDSSIFIPREAARAWLATKRGFTPTRIGEGLTTTSVLNDSFLDTAEAGDYVRQLRTRMKMTPKSLLDAAGVSMGEREYNQLEEGTIPGDESVLTALGTALGVNAKLFALRLLEARQKLELLELSRRISQVTNA